MAVTLETLRNETQEDLQESPTSSNTLYKAANYIAWYNEFVSRFGYRIRLEIAPVEYTWPASQSSVALSTIATGIMQVHQIEILDSDGKVTGEWRRNARGDEDGFYLWNGTLYLNGDAPSEAVSTKWWVIKTPSSATLIGDSADVPSGYERSLLLPWFKWKAYSKSKKFATAQGFLNEFYEALKTMTVERNRLYNPAAETWTTHEDYEPYTG